MFSKPFTLIVVLIGMSVGSLFGQAGRGTIRGTISDPSGAVVSGAHVSAVNEATGVRSLSTTTTVGSYNIPDLLPGTYTVEVEDQGFKKLLRQNVRVNAGAISAVDLTLELGATTETVTVNAAAPVLEKETSSQGTTINPQLVSDLPLAVGSGRNPTAFSVLAPGTRTGEPGSFGGFFATTFNGGQTLSGEIEIDGLSVNYTPAQGQPDAVTHTPPEAVEEISILTSGASAEFVSSTGTQNYIVRSGTNQFHGNLYEFLRNTVLDARGFFPANRPVERRNEFGGSVGGPIWIPHVFKGTDKAFFFFNYDGFRFQTTPTSTLTTVPTAAFKQGDFSQLKDTSGNPIPIYDPLTTVPDGLGGFIRTQFPGNIIPPNRISTVAKNILPYFPDPNRPGNIFNFLGSSASPQTTNSYAMKYDFRASEKNSFTFSLVGFKNSSTGGSIFGDPNGANPSNFTALTHKTFRFAYDRILNPRVMNHLDLGFNRRIRFNSNGTPGSPAAQPWDVKLGITGMNDPSKPGGTAKCSWPVVSFTGIFSSDSAGLGSYEHLGRGTGDPVSDDIVNTYILQDNLSWVKGRNNMKFGAQVRFDQNNNANTTGCGGFAFVNTETSFPTTALRTTTGDAFASFMLGATDSAGWGISNLHNALRWRYYAYFFQDDIKVRRNLTLNLGVRYDLWMPYFDAFDNYTIMDQSVPNPAAGGIPGAIIYAGTGPGRSGRRRLTNGIDSKDISPHVGFAWTPRNNLVMRAAGNLSYFPSYPYGTGNFRGIAMGYNTSSGTNSPDGITPAFNWDNGYPVATPIPPIINAGYGVGQGGISTYWPTAQLLSYMVQWNYNIQYNFASNWMLDIGYVGNGGNRLISGTANINQVNSKYLALGDLLNKPINDPAVVAQGFTPPYPNFVASFPYTPTLAQALRPFPQYAGLDLGPENGPGFGGSGNIGHSTYHALQIKLNKQLSQGLYMLTSYTWSKKMTDADSSWGGFFSTAARDTYNRKIEKALSPSNPPQRLTSAFTYELPIGPGKHFLNAKGPAGKILGGWQLNGVLTYQSGFPLFITGPNDLFLFNYVNTPDSVPGINPKLFQGGKFDPARDIYLNHAAFASPAPFKFGTAPQVLPNVRDFPLFNEDLGIMKRFKIREAMNLEFRNEWFNAFNRVRFGIPNGSWNPTGVGFGVVSSQANSARYIQFALKLNF